MCLSVLCLTQLQSLYRQKSRSALTNGQEVRDWRPSCNCDAVTSTSTPLLPDQPARLFWLNRQCRSLWLRYTALLFLLHPTPPPCCPTQLALLVIYLLRAFLIWGWVAHQCSRRVCPCERKLPSLAEDLWTSARVSKQSTKKLLQAASSCRNHIQMNFIFFFTNSQECVAVFRAGKRLGSSYVSVRETFCCTSSLSWMSHFWHSVMLISMSANCQIKKSRK